MKKYELTDESIEHWGFTLYRIRALRDFGDVKAGDLGGFVESEDNLSHDGDCWVFDDARVRGEADVYGDAHVYGNAHVHGNAHVSGKAWVCGEADVYGDAHVYGNAHVHGNAWVYGNAHVSGKAWVRGETDVYGNAHVYGDAHVYGNARIGKNGKVDSNDDFLTISNIGLENDNITFYKNRNNGISVTYKRFQGTIDEFEESLKTHNGNEFDKQYQLAIQFAKLKLSR